LSFFRKTAKKSPIGIFFRLLEHFFQKIENNFKDNSFFPDKQDRETYGG